MADHMHHHQPQEHEQHSEEQPSGVETVRDPVCGMEVKISAETRTAERMIVLIRKACLIAFLLGPLATPYSTNCYRG